MLVSRESKKRRLREFKIKNSRRDAEEQRKRRRGLNKRISLFVLCDFVEKKI